MNKLFFFVIVLSFLLFSCQIEDFLANYRDVNLIEDYPFSSPLWQADDATSTYMLWQEESSVQYNGVNAYRLRTNNLIPNGDFETGASAGWGTTGSGTASAVNTSPIRGSYSLSINLSNDSANLAYFDMSNLADSAAYPDSTNISVRFKYKPEIVSGTLPLEYRNGTTSTDELSYSAILSADSTASVIDFPSYGSASNGFLWNSAFTSQFLMFNSPASPVSNINFLLDDVRITRTDGPVWVRLRLAKEGDTPQPLITGTYRLSFMVRQDTVSANNVFDASRISVRINTAYDSASDLFIDNGGIYGVDASSSWSSGWQAVSVDIPVVIYASSASEPAMEICISASDPSSVFYMDAGSILVAAPHLELIE